MSDVPDKGEIVIPEAGGSTGDPTARDRRSSGERRRYNRRSNDNQVSPPYYEAFDRMATALEELEHIVGAGLGVTFEPPPGTPTTRRS